MPDILSRSEQLRQERAQGLGLGATNPDRFAGYSNDLSPDNAASKGSLLGDVLLAPFRGAEGLVQGVYGLADTLLGDALPDYDSRLLGQSETGLGGFVEGTSQFLLGFVPVAGWIGRGATVGGKFSLASGLSTKAQAAAKASGARGLGGLSPLSAATHVELRRAGIAGAIVDFAGFDGQEARLSNLIQESDTLRNEVSAFLASDEEDSELFGRLKNVFEGYILGMVADTAIEGGKAAYKAFAKSKAEELAHGVGTVKEMQKAKAAGASEEELAGIASSRYAYQRTGRPDAALESEASRVFEDNGDASIESARDLIEDWEDIHPLEHEGALFAMGRSIENAAGFGESDKLTQVLALMGSDRRSNTDAAAALNAWGMFKSGIPREEFLERVTHTASESVAQILYDGADFYDAAAGRASAEAVYSRLSSAIDPTRPVGALFDAELGRAFGFASQELSPAQHRLVSTQVREAADAMGWSANGVRAALVLRSRELAGDVGDPNAVAAVGRETRRVLEEEALEGGESFAITAARRLAERLQINEYLPKRLRSDDPLRALREAEPDMQAEFAASVTNPHKEGIAFSVEDAWRYRLTGDPFYLPKHRQPLDLEGQSLRDARGTSLKGLAEEGEVRGTVHAYRVVDGEGRPLSSELVTDPAHIGGLLDGRQRGGVMQEVTVRADQVELVPSPFGGNMLKHRGQAHAAQLSSKKMIRALDRMDAPSMYRGGRVPQLARGLDSLVDLLDASSFRSKDAKAIANSLREFDKRLSGGRKGRSLFEDVRFITGDVDDNIGGVYDYGSKVLALNFSRNAMKKPGHMLRTIYHEMWHHLEGFLTPEQWDKVKASYLGEKQRLKEMSKIERERLGSDWRRGYRYTNEREWFAEAMADKTLQWRLASMDPDERSLFVRFVESLERAMLMLHHRLVKLVRGPESGNQGIDSFLDEIFADFKGLGGTERKWSPLDDRGILPLDDGMRVFSLNGPVGQASVRPLRDTLLANLVGDDTAQGIARAIEERSGMGWPSGVNPREKAADGSFVYSNQDLLAMQLQRNDLNLSRFEGDEDALAAIRTAEALFGEYAPEKVTFGEQHEQALEQLSDMMGGQHPERAKAELLSDIAGDAEAARALNARVLARKMLLLKNSNKVADLAKKAANPRASKDDLVAFREAVDFHAKLTLGVRSLVAEQGRGLGSGRIPIRDIEVDPKRLGEQLDEALTSAGGERKVRKLAEEVASALEAGVDEGSVGSLSRIAQGAQQKPSMLLEYWINAILSGPQTQLVNILANTMTTIFLPLEKMLGGALTFNADAVMGGWRELVSLGESFREALQFSKLSVKEGRSILAPDTGKLDDPRLERNAITGDRIAEKIPALQGREEIKGMLDVTGAVIRVPTRLLTSADELFKQWNFRSKLRADLLSKASAEGLRGEGAARFVRQEMDKFFYQGQAYSAASEFRRGLEDGVATGVPDEGLRAHAKQYAQQSTDPERLAMAESAMARAEEATFTRPLRPGSLSRKIQEAVSAHPLLRLVMPFIRTPVNIATFAGQRLDVSSLSPVIRSLVAKKPFSNSVPAIRDAQQRLVKDIASGDPLRKSEAVGRLAMGFGLSYTMMNLAMSGRVTGRGPQDPELRQVMMGAGWQPYSILVDGKYISYARLDPLASLIGVPADLIGYSQWSTQADQTVLEEATYGMVYAFSSNFISKTYLTGVRNLVEMLWEPERKIRPEMQRLGASFLPFSSFVNQLNQANDTALREVRTMGEAVRAKIPGMSDDLEPVRNVLGDPVHRSGRLGMETLGSPALFFSPIAMSEVSSDTLHQEFLRLGHPFNPPYPKRDGVDLRVIKNPDGRRAYDRWMELHGEVKLGGMSLKQSLRKAIRDKDYQRLSPESTHEVDSPRIAVLQRILQRYRQAAYRKMVGEFPDLREERERISRQRMSLFFN